MIGELRSIAHPELEEALSRVGARVDDVYGMTIGEVAGVWTDPATGRPRWLLIQSGRFGGHHTLVPYEDASGGPDDVWIPYDRATVRMAPGVNPAEPLEGALEAQLDEHYAAAREAAAPSPQPPPARPRADHAHRLG